MQGEQTTTTTIMMIQTRIVVELKMQVSFPLESLFLSWENMHSLQVVVEEQETQFSKHFPHVLFEYMKWALLHLMQDLASAQSAHPAKHELHLPADKNSASKHMVQAATFCTFSLQSLHSYGHDLQEMPLSEV